MLKSTAIFIGLSLLVAPLSSSQSLAEVAKKEKERREKVEEDVETIDDWELQQADGDGLSVTGSEVSDEEPSRKPSTSSATSPSGSSTTPDAKEMRRRREAYDKQVASARASLASAQANEKQCRQALRRPGSVYVVDDGCKGAAARVQRAQDRLRRATSRKP